MPSSPSDTSCNRDKLLKARCGRVLAAMSAVGLAMLPAQAQRTAARPSFADLSLVELMQIEVTTVSKHREKLASAPAAIFVLNGEDMQRAGVATLPDALRLVPGMQVGKVGAHDWAISARGFADVFSNKLLVLQDGRSVYTPLFSGVFWDSQDAVFEDIDRIEVVRGPGATLWGANAVNGVINIISKPAAETQGAFGAVSGGSEPRFSARARYGGEIDAKTKFRVYGKYSRHNDLPALAGGSAGDDWREGQTGFRVDRDNGSGTALTLQGDAFRGGENQIYSLPSTTPPFFRALPSETTFSGGNLLGRATHRLTGDSELMVQGYFDYTDRHTPIFEEIRRTFDLEVQHRFSRWSQEIIFGAGYRSTSDSGRNSPNVALTPSHAVLNLESAFVQDDIAFSKSTHLILGTKLEHNDYTGLEIQPGARLLWIPNEQHTFWTSVARAVRTPSRSEEDVTFWQVTPIPGVSSLLAGNRRFDSEALTAYEAGWRFHGREKFTVDLATFVNRYRGLRTSELTPLSLFALAQLSNPNPALPPPFPIKLAGQTANAMHGETYGAEIAVATQVASGWRVRASYSYLSLALHRDPRSTDISAEDEERRSPQGQGYLWSQHDLAQGVKFDWVLRGVGRLPVGAIPAYVALDARLAWRPAKAWEVSVAGRNLTDRKHPEFLPAGIITPAAENARSVEFEIKYDF